MIINFSKISGARVRVEPCWDYLRHLSMESCGGQAIGVQRLGS